jgi:maltooligosyltrehalose trehalohydrolase
MKVGAWYLGSDRCEFTVWAPHAKTVTLEIVASKHQSVPMQPQQSGYWQVTTDHTPAATRYLYRLDDHQPRPDPASHFQPFGVHEPSEVIDHTFEWQDQQWSGVALEDMIIYETHVGAFTLAGTFDAIIPRLQTLKELGITAIELMPIAQFPGDHPTDDPQAYRNWGYDGVYPFAVQNSYGGVLGLKRLVNACHQHGISVILDVVYNHFGPEGNYLNQFGDYFTETYKTPWGSAINFDDAYSHHVRDFFIENTLYWLRDYHIDALRLDAVHAIYDLGAKHFLEELSEKVEQLSQHQGQKFYLIAESDLNNARIIRPYDVGGYGLDAQWSDDFHHALHALLTGSQTGYYQDFGECAHLAKAYQDTFVYDWQYAPHRSRYHGSPALDRPFHQFVVCIQNHDQIGNQMLGERLSQLIPFESLKLAAGAVILSPYIPLLFMGEEYAEDAPFTYFVSHSDPDLIRAVRNGRRQEFAAFHYEGEPPDPESPETFKRCKLNWEKRHEGQHQVMWSFYQRLMQLRRSLSALMKNDRSCLSANSDEAKKLVWWQRWDENQHLICAMNFSESNQEFEFGDQHWRKILDSADKQWLGSGSELPEKIAPRQNGKLRSHSFVLYERLSL